MKKPVYYVLLAILLAVFCISAFLVVNYYIEGQKQAENFDNLSQLVQQGNAQTPPTEPAPTQGNAPEETQAPTVESGPSGIQSGMIPGYGAAFDMNQDMVGWIRIDGTKVNYPVMHTPNDPDYYLKLNFDKEYSEWGSIYMREDCNIWTPSDNVTLYGHCMRDGSMFADLHKYLEKDFWETHQLVYFDTLFEYHVYEIFAVFKTSANLGEGFRYHLFVDAGSEAEYNEFVAECKRLSFYDTGITPEYGDKLVTLSTCEYTLDNGRLVVVARRIF